MENLVSLNEFIRSEVYDTSDKELTEYLKEEYLDEIFSSEFFNLEELNESKKQEEQEALVEYRKIKKHLREGKQYKRITKRFFELHKQYMRTALNEDKKHLRYTTELLTEKLNELNEDCDDYTLKQIRKNKITKLQSYKNKTIRQVNKELREMEKFFNSNPKILLV